MDSPNEQAPEFVAEHIRSALQLELALYFGGRPESMYTAADLSERLGQSQEAVEVAADDLTARRLLRRHGRAGPLPTCYALTNGDPVRRLVTALAQRCAADEAFAEELRAQFASSPSRWLMEQILEEFAPFAALRTRQRLALHFILMGIVALVLRHTMGLPAEALVRVLLVIAIVTAWSGLLVIVARDQRSIRIPPEGRRRAVIRSYRHLLFHPSHLEVVPGFAVFGAALVVVFGHPGGGPGIAEQWLGRPPGALLAAFIALMAWEVAYRVGAGLWVTGASLWRMMALRRHWEAAEPSRAPARLARRLRRADQLLALVPAGFAAVGAAFFDSDIVVALCALGAVVTGIVAAAVYFLTPSPDALGGAPGSRLRLRPGAHIAVIGGGPAGALFAHVALREAETARLPLRISIFDGKDFHRFGPPGCNMCAGVVSESLYERLQELGFDLPPEVVQSKVSGFHLHTAVGSAHIARREGTRRLRTVFRGNGPRDAELEHSISFDDYLLRCVQDAGVEVIPQPVTQIVPPADPAGLVTVHYGAGEAPQQMQADVVVGAFGLNSNLGEMIAALGFGYRPPEAVRACNAEIPLPPGADGRLRGSIHILTLDRADIVFTAFTPKQQHVTMTIVGTRDVGIKDLDGILQHPRVVALLEHGAVSPTYDCECRPRYVVRDGRHVYTDRLVMIGDAACSRLYKNGLESALVTAELAARTIIRHGVSRRAFEQHYEPACRRRIVRDNAYGRLLFAAHRAVQRRGRLLRAQLRLMGEDSPAGERLREVVWALFTGAQPYRSILRSALDPRIHLGVLRHGITGLLRRPCKGDQ
ncbi:MAG: hypothetical protein PVH68_03965 [Armatimonadota bacterium]